MTEHPGTIALFEGDALLRVIDAADVSDGIKFVETEAGPVPVVKIVAKLDPDGRTLLSYGAGERLLSSTYQRAIDEA